MPTEDQMRAAMAEYINAFNRVDLEGILALYADDATVEDPVGTPIKLGAETLREFYTVALESGAQLALSAPIRTSRGNEAAMAFDISLTLESGPCVIRAIDVMTFNEAGQFTSMRAFWGPSDMVAA